MKILRSAFNKYTYSKKKLRSVLILFLGLAALIWFLIRVIPKPSRATYPCMQAAFPFASALILWVTGILSSSLLFVQAKATWRRSKYIIASSLAFLALLVFILTSTSVKQMPVMARAYIFTNSLLGNELPEMQSFTSLDNSVIEPSAFVGAIKSSQAHAEDIVFNEIQSMVSLAIERAGGLEGIVEDGDTVIIKPNLVVSTDGTSAAQQLDPEVNGITTDFRVVQAVVNLVRDINPSGVVYIMEGSAAGSTSANMTILNYHMITGIDSLICLEDVCGPWGDTTSVHLKPISLPADKFLYNGANNRYWLYKTYHEADVVISMPVLKNHCFTGTTGSVKNVGIGSTPPSIYSYDPDLLRWRIDHENPPRTNLHYFIHDYFMCRPVDFVVVDGLQSVQNGPVGNSSTPNLAEEQMNMRLILASREPVAVDAIQSLLCAHDPELIPHLVALHNDSIGCCDARLIRVYGIKVGDEKQNFDIFDTGELSEYEDFEAPIFSVNECSVINNQLHFSLEVEEDVTKVEVSLDGTYLNQIAIGSFDDFAFDLDTIDVNSMTEVVVYAYDRYLNYSSIDISGMVSTAEHYSLPVKIEVYPNPCSNVTRLKYNIREQIRVRCDLYQASGIKVRSLLDEQKTPGLYLMEINVSDLGAGVYFLRFHAGEQMSVRKLLIQ